MTVEVVKRGERISSAALLPALPVFVLEVLTTSQKSALASHSSEARGAQVLSWFHTLWVEEHVPFGNTGPGALRAAVASTLKHRCNAQVAPTAASGVGRPVQFNGWPIAELFKNACSSAMLSSTFARHKRYQVKKGRHVEIPVHYIQDLFVKRQAYLGGRRPTLPQHQHCRPTSRNASRPLRRMQSSVGVCAKRLGH